MSRSWSEDQIKALALLLRKKLGIEKIECPDMVVLLDKAKQLLKFNWLLVRNSELPEAEGMYDPTERVLKIPDKVFEALQRGSPRSRFSIAHEIAHVALGHEKIRFRHTEKKVYERATYDIRREEREADTFAGFFLAPDDIAEGCATVEEFMLRFGLSRHAAEIRKKDHDRYLRLNNGKERPLTPMVTEYLERQRSMGHKVTSLKGEPPKARKIDTSSPMNAPTYRAAITKTSLDPEVEICSECGHLALTRNGLEMVCSNCHFKSQL